MDFIGFGIIKAWQHFGNRKSTGHVYRLFCMADIYYNYFLCLLLFQNGGILYKSVVTDGLKFNVYINCTLCRIGK